MTAPTLPRVVAAEWTKLAGLRGPALVAVATVLVSGLLTFAAANASSVDPGFDPLDSLTAGLSLAQVGPLVLGVLVGTGEFSSGTFRATFTAVPRRLPVLAAQTVVTAAAALVTAVLAVGAAVAGLLPAARSRGIPLELTTHGTPQVLAGMVAFLVGLALFGLAVGALLRRPTPAFVAVLAVALVLPIALMLATDVAAGPTTAPAGDPTALQSAVNTLVTLLPSGAGALLATPPGAGGVEGAPDLGPWGGGLVLAAWVLVPLAAAAARLRGRDLT